MRRSSQPAAFRIACGAVAGMLLLPVCVLVVFSFNSDRFPSLPWRGSTLQWYSQAFSDGDLQRAVGLSLRISAMVAALSVVSGGLAAWGMLYKPAKWAIPVSAAFTLPILVPPLMLGISVRSACAAFIDPGAYWRVVVAHVVVYSPIAFSFLFVRMLSATRTYEVVARDLGATAWNAFVHIHLPLVAPTIVSSALIVLLLSWDEFTMSWMLLDVDATYPVRVWGMLEGAVSPEVNAVGTLAILASAVAFGVTLVLLNVNSSALAGSGEQLNASH